MNEIQIKTWENIPAECPWTCFWYVLSSDGIDETLYCNNEKATFIPRAVLVGYPCDQWREKQK